MDTVGPIDLPPELKLAQVYATMVHQQLVEMVGCDPGCVQVTLRPDRTIERRYTFEVLLGPWEGAAACHRYQGAASVGMTRLAAKRAPDPIITAIVAKDTGKIAHHVAEAIKSEHRFKRRRPICLPGCATERGLDEPLPNPHGQAG